MGINNESDALYYLKQFSEKALGVQNGANDAQTETFDNILNTFSIFDIDKSGTLSNKEIEYIMSTDLFKNTQKSLDEKNYYKEAMDYIADLDGAEGLSYDDLAKLVQTVETSGSKSDGDFLDRRSGGNSASELVEMQKAQVANDKAELTIIGESGIDKMDLTDENTKNNIESKTNAALSSANASLEELKRLEGVWRNDKSPENLQAYANQFAVAMQDQKILSMYQVEIADIWYSKDIPKDTKGGIGTIKFNFEKAVESAEKYLNETALGIINGTIQ